MIKRTLIVLGCLLATGVSGCKDKAANKQPPPQTGSQAPAGDPHWIDKLPAVSGGDTQLLLQYANGLVKLAADGSLQLASAPTAAPTDPRTPGADPLAAGKPVQLGGLGEALNLTPVVARTESVLGVVEAPAGSGSAVEQNPADVAFARLAHPVATLGAPAPARRMTSAFALAHPNDVSGGVIVFADASAPARVLVDVMTQTGGFLAVRRGNQLGALSIALDRNAPALASPLHPWFELRFTGKSLELEAVPSKPTPIASVDQVGEAVKAAGVKAVDVLVDKETTAQDLVAVIEQLRAQSVDAIGFGAVPGRGDDIDSGARGDQTARVIAWDFYLADGDRSAADKFRAALIPAFAPMRTCYAAVLAKTKDAGGTAQLDITAAANGKVQGARATGVAPALVACAVNAAKALQFSGAAKLSTKVGFVPR